ncbi:family 2A encapsulin nanocompartment cargo protein cysteine desulfurase [Azohydromonas lata]|uniref:Cysteine desulfurase n=1 Tax=Azohydromonas lata TaxID=45677 RepID=A0ABU5IG10_9BURK|nr:family 2A encapsulin nanocompartment cargo protein cysteine desulfurase [Azohydromonas lata]MDZ5458065.1 family 2A encapsulin nanocompartment cargo protein cysteine desulfurase [Azohydromonas lata]
MPQLTPSDAAPPGLPDAAALARLAGELFAALPGQDGAPNALLQRLLPGRDLRSPALPAAGALPLPAQPQPAGLTLPPGTFGPATPASVPFGALPPGHQAVPTSPQSAANLPASLPSRVPHAQAANGVPDLVLGAAPAYEPRLGSAAQDVPQAAASPASASLQRGDGAPPLATAAEPAATAAAPYYFLDLPKPTAAGAEPAAAGRPTLPGLGAFEVPRLNTPTPPSTPAGVPGGSGFYFLQHATPAVVQAPPQVGATATHPPFDVHAVRRDFPILQERVNGRQLVWFDNAATTHKPQAVIDRLAHFYAHENSNIHRAAHALAARATDAYEGARETVRRFIGAASVEEIVFVRGTTEAVNLVAKSWGAKNIGEGDEIIVSHLEHHANIVPWQQLAAEKGAKLRVIPVDDSGQVILEAYQRLLNSRTKLVSVTQVSNALGTVVPVQEIVDIAHRHGVRTLVDGAQSVSHLRVDMQALDTDFFVFSGHKIFGPTGIGVVYGKREVLEDMPPWQGGGNMIADVTFERTVFHAPPTRFEAGTGNIADAVGLAAALEYVERIGIENIGRYEHALLDYATQHMRPIPGVRLVGTARDKASVLSFVLDGYGTGEVGQALNQEGIAVRTGHHCAQPILRRFGLEATVRPSLAFYNTCEEVDRMVKVVRQLAGKRR